MQHYHIPPALHKSTEIRGSINLAFSRPTFQFMVLVVFLLNCAPMVVLENKKYICFF